MRLEHKAMQVDWDGQTAALADTDTEERLDTYLFVAVLPCTNTETFPDIKQDP